MFIFAMKLDSEKSVYLVRLRNYNMGTCTQSKELEIH